MRVYSVKIGNEFVEYVPQRFMNEHREEMIETWLEQNPECIVENGGLLIIGRQVTTNLNSSIDLLGVDREGNLAVVELKRDKTPRDTLAQALEYASYAITLSSNQLEEIYQLYTGDENASLVEIHRRFFSLVESEAVSLNKDQRIVIVGSEIVQSIRQSTAFLRQKGLLLTCLEFTYFQTESGEQLVSIDTVVGQEPLGPGKVVTGTLPKTNKDEFLKACDEAGKAMFGPLLDMAESEKLPIHWGSRGFTLNLDHAGIEIALCFGYPQLSKPNQTPQSLYTAFREIARKVEGSGDTIENIKRRFLDTRKFLPAGKFEVKYLIKQVPTPELVIDILKIIHDLTQEVRTLAGSDSE
ncbi:MAG: hypothetical protein A2W33_03645 [Chloroflexi bacterium RBG_16_52_11]|nr:MAG: hypothetical protein A2W33_03645 [Chloroflexi bacterium RBG_16_52_11]